MDHEDTEHPEQSTELRRPLPNNWFRNDVVLSLCVIALGLFFSYVWWLTGTLEVGLDKGARVELWPLVVSVILTSATLAFRRWYPIVSGVAGTSLLLAFGIMGVVEIQTSQVVLYVGFYSIGAWSCHRRAAFYSRLVLLVVIVIWLMYVSYLMFSAGGQSPAATVSAVAAQWLINLIFYSAAWYFGDKSWRSFLDQRQLHATLRELSAAHETIAAKAVQDERLHIARELHDVVAHHVTVMGIHASAARRILKTSTNEAAASTHSADDENPAPAESSLGKAIAQIEQVETTSSQAVKELQNLVYTLRDQTSYASPLPDITQLHQLVEESNSGTQNVVLHVVGEKFELTSAIELTLYRVAQEALSNARKHAGAQANLDVRLRYSPGLVELDVSDDGRTLVTRRPGTTIGTGTGIAGMRERLAAVGGRLEVGPKSRGGWLVRATIPCETHDGTAPAYPTTSNHSSATQTRSTPSYNTSGDDEQKETSL